MTILRLILRLILGLILGFILRFIMGDILSDMGDILSVILFFSLAGVHYARLGYLSTVVCKMIVGGGRLLQMEA